jgi:hypothetical protein
MKDETYCIYIEKSHAIFIVFTIIIIFIVAIISENIVEAAKIITFAAIPIILLILMDNKTNKPQNPQKPQYEPIIQHVTQHVSHPPPPPQLRPQPQPKVQMHYPTKYDKYQGNIDRGYSDDEDEEDDKFIKHGSAGTYNTYTGKNNFYTHATRMKSRHNIDDYMASSRRNDPRREQSGTFERHRKIKGYFENDFNEGRDWWGNKDY